MTSYSPRIGYNPACKAKNNRYKRCFFTIGATRGIQPRRRAPRYFSNTAGASTAQINHHQAIHNVGKCAVHVERQHGAAKLQVLAQAAQGRLSRRPPAPLLPQITPPGFADSGASKLASQPQSLPARNCLRGATWSSKLATTGSQVGHNQSLRCLAVFAADADRSEQHTVTRMLLLPSTRCPSTTTATPGSFSGEHAQHERGRETCP